MKGFENFKVLTIEAGENLTKKRFVDFEGKHTVNKKALGVAMDDTTSGDQCSLACGGIVVVEAGGSITAGNLVESDADGKAVALTLTTNTAANLATDLVKICGLAMDSASSGEFLRVFMGGL